MKKYLIVALVFFTAFAYSQKTEKNKDEYTPVEITKSNGSKMTVLFKRITLPRLSNFKEVFGGSQNTNVKIEYKTSENGTTEKINSKDIVMLKFLNKNHDEIAAYERLAIKQFDRNNQLKDTKQVLYMPQVYDGKISIYGEANFICQDVSRAPSNRNNNFINCEYAYSTFYLKNNAENFAVTPLDIKLFNMERSYDNFVNAFKAAGKDCPEFTKYLEAFREKMDDKEFAKKMKEDAISYRKEVKKKSRELDLSKEERLNYVGEKLFFYEAQFYIGIVKEYEKNFQN
ncbi:hypothetical protein CHRY9390_03038 [Chryseobacterium aquaeductus]|uniref:Uncharacterized protein n=1 Tax=Chryseobacterium aquaeductus TaxID=2675056 RepID=A0A9N8MK26_9FLAO|nr:hypothetical protein [Chryseobacterium aquaeductus]CAA7332316.1 hypothetical protein CHRY9390_03038 [Chryseobacterium potabilaquae]CAD7815788.1 hypothetical protein CHRY9390_03038 [Chryseobacterium aquaeductus]